MKIPEWVKKYIGIPFVDFGRDLSGCDCWGLTRLISKNEFSLVLESYDSEYKEVYSQAVVNAIDAYGVNGDDWQEIEPGKEREGDHILMTGIYEFEGKKVRAPLHVGLVIAPGALIHTEIGHDSVWIKYKDNRGLVNRIVGFYRHKTQVEN